MATLERSVNRCTTIDRELSLIVCPAKKRASPDPMRVLLGQPYVNINVILIYFIFSFYVENR